MADNRLLGTGGMYYNNNEIGKAYLGNSLIWATTPGEIFAVNSSSPLTASSGSAIKLIITKSGYNTTTITSFKFQCRLLGFAVTGGTLIRQINNGTEQYNRFFATSSTKVYFDYNMSQRTSAKCSNFFTQPREFEFGQEKTFTTNKFYIKDLETNTVIATYNTNANAGNNNIYPWSLWSYASEIYGFSYIKFYVAYNYGNWVLEKDYEAQKLSNGKAVLYDKVSGTTLSNTNMYAYEYRNI